MSEPRDLRRSRHAIPPQSEEIEQELERGNRKLLHCLACGRQLAAIRHGDACLCCGSEAIVIETWS